MIKHIYRYIFNISLPKHFMNKKAYIVTQVSFKKYLILLTIGILLVSIYYYFAVLRPLGIAPSFISCPKGLISDRLNLMLSISGNGYVSPYSTTMSYGNPWVNYNATWLDGTEMGFFTCPSGSNQGENVNYLYCKNIFYAGKEIGADGNVKKDWKVYLDIVVDSKDKNEEGFKVISYKCR
jgi:hypothetical protein